MARVSTNTPSAGAVRILTRLVIAASLSTHASAEVVHMIDLLQEGRNVRPEYPGAYTDVTRTSDGFRIGIFSKELVDIQGGQIHWSADEESWWRVTVDQQEIVSGAEPGQFYEDLITLRYNPWRQLGLNFLPEPGNTQVFPPMGNRIVFFQDSTSRPAYFRSIRLPTNYGTTSQLNSSLPISTETASLASTTTLHSPPTLGDRKRTRPTVTSTATASWTKPISLCWSSNSGEPQR